MKAKLLTAAAFSIGLASAAFAQSATGSYSGGNVPSSVTDPQPGYSDSAPATVDPSTTNSITAMPNSSACQTGNMMHPGAGSGRGSGADSGSSTDAAGTSPQTAQSDPTC